MRLRRLWSSGMYRLSRLLPPLRPSVVIAGAQKAGTTALFEYLSQHPRVAPPLLKEINFFNCRVRYGHGLSFYHAHFPRRTPARRGRISLDASPGYLVRAETTAGRIRAYNAAMKVIVLVRNPVERAYSAWQMYRRYAGENRDWFAGWVTMCDGQPAVARFARRQDSFGRCFAADVEEEIVAIERGVSIEMPLLDHGLYDGQLKTYLEHFPSEQVLVLCSEDMRAGTIAVLRTTEEFLNLAPHAWSDESVRPRFEGRYEEGVPARARELLTEWYRTPNGRLFELLGRELPWS